MSEDYGLAVKATFKDASKAQSVCDALDWKKKKRVPHAAFEGIDLPEALRATKGAVSASWTLHGIDLWEDAPEDVTRIMRAFVESGGTEVFACLDATADDVSLTLFHWKHATARKLKLKLTAEDKKAFHQRKSLIDVLARLIEQEPTKERAAKARPRKPADKAWRLNKKELAARDALWLEIEADIDRTFLRKHLDEKHRRLLRKYFDDGMLIGDYGFKKPVLCDSLPLFYRAWFHPKRDQATFDALQRPACAIQNLRYTEAVVRQLVGQSLPTLDDVMPRFYDLFYLHPERVLRGFDENSGLERRMGPRKPLANKGALAPKLAAWLKKQGTRK